MSQKSTIISAITLTNTLIKHPDCYQWSQKSSEVFSDSQTKSHFHFQSYCFHCASLIYYSLFTKYRQVLCGLCNHTVKWFVSFLCGSLDCDLGNPSFRVCVAFGWGLCIPWVCVSLNYGYLYSPIWVCIYAILYLKKRWGSDSRRMDIHCLLTYINSTTIITHLNSQVIQTKH